mmetsp:Transcript_18136/g.17286  ORF Transcript_18136/g.17286 Transcript_18136/m.17286 type:complete len:412 (-) Transcript_18136:1023-2258(-)|eukprot:CAMPEP_0170555398 /NCGR_PEP_ID=MMETSP0211-20121228/13293_1 /TAXON_ID=311385 /ORGANISM="Pseudokeronopsis sp., Strain OXSARD2" /LENGTH=411 /DNA_ID=CAMNT_0010865205 /DNA_START=251 /DNA_END=1486 /DNA_ORIENTATION=+
MNCSHYTPDNITLECYESLFSLACNKLYVESEDESVNTKATSYLSPGTNCASEGCLEYQYRQSNVTSVDGEFGFYSNYSFIIDLSANHSENELALKKLRENKWLNNFTRAIVIQWTVYCTWIDSYVSFNVMVEHLANGVLLSRYVSNSISANAEVEDLISVIYGLFFVVIIVSIIRLVYEYNYDLSHKLVCLGDAINYTFLLGAIITHYINTGLLKELLSFKMEHQSVLPYYDFSRFVVLWNTQLSFLGFSTLFLPFKVFQILSYFKVTEPLIKVLNSIFRITPFVINVSLILLTTYMFWTQGLFLLLNQDVRNFRTFYNSALTFLYKEYYNYEDFKYFFNDPRFARMVVIIPMFIIIRLTIFGMIIATVMYYYKKASSFDKNQVITPSKAALEARLFEIKKKLTSISLNH